MLGTGTTKHKPTVPYWLAGVPKPGVGGIYPPNNLTVSPQQFEYGLHLHPPQ